MKWVIWQVFGVVCVCLLWAGSSQSYAQSWQTMEQNGITFFHQMPDSSTAQRFLQHLLMQREVVRKKLGHIPAVSMQVYLAPSQAVFDEITQGRLPHWSLAVAMPASRKMVLKAGPSEQLAQTIQHEMSHILLHSVIQQPVPVWFHEGMAMWVSREWRLQHTASVFYAVLSGGLIPLSEIDAVLRFPSVKADLAYTESLLAVLYILRLGGENGLVAMISELSHQAPFEVALFRVTEQTPYEFERSWNDYVSGRFSLTALLVSPDSLWGYLVLLFLLVYVVVKVRNRAKLRRWELEEQAEELALKVYRPEDTP